jgi:hypothetical protein
MLINNRLLENVSLFQGYIANNSVIQQPAQIQNQQSFNCQQGMILPSTSYIQSPQQLVQQLSGGQLVGRPLGAGGGGVQAIVSSPQSFLSPSNSTGLMNSCLSGGQWIS